MKGGDRRKEVEARERRERAEKGGTQPVAENEDLKKKIPKIVKRIDDEDDNKFPDMTDEERQQQLDLLKSFDKQKPKKVVSEKVIPPKNSKRKKK